MKHVAIVLAGGKGSRMNSDIPKQYMQLMGKPVLYYSLKAFQESDIDEIVLVVGKGEIDSCRADIVDAYGFTKIANIVEGGSERYYSVLNGLRAIKECDYVYIHDGARPCISLDVIKRCMEDVVQYKACIAAVPVKDTIKIADTDGYAAQTPDRNHLWQIQTPQCFAYDIVRAAYEDMAADESRGNITDDAMVVEKYTNAKVKLTMASYKNIKITTPEDIAIAEIFLNKS